jgi:hypothetical protein
MKQYTESKTFKFSRQQMDAFRKLEDYNVNVSHFVRLAISEKIKRDWPGIKEKKERVLMPF